MSATFLAYENMAIYLFMKKPEDRRLNNTIQTIVSQSSRTESETAETMMMKKRLRLIDTSLRPSSSSTTMLRSMDL
jgi:hypothetical protein